MHYTPEPFQRLVNQGLIPGDDGVKMSKSRGNVVHPDSVIDEYGADSHTLKVAGSRFYVTCYDPPESDL